MQDDKSNNLRTLLNPDIVITIFVFGVGVGLILINYRSIPLNLSAGLPN
jgi:hypothetical protein